MKWRHRARLAIVGLCVFGWFVTGCSSANKPTDDIDDDLGTYDETGWTIVLNFDEFPNVGYRCVGGDKVYVTTRDSDSLIVVANHPECQEPGSG